jgi:hypothetical protein
MFFDQLPTTSPERLPLGPKPSSVPQSCCKHGRRGLLAVILLDHLHGCAHVAGDLEHILTIDTWKKGDLKIEHLKVYRSGWIIVDQLPDLSGYDPEEGVNIFEEFEFDEHQLHDGSNGASIFPNELPAEERNRLLALSEAELADEGWTLDSVTRFKGPLIVEEV